MTLEELLEGVVIPIDKPRQWTSFQAVNKVKAAIRNTYGIKKFKIGHAGTLDPLATGLLLICVGKATKRIDELQSGEKAYTGTMVLGATTPCYDLERAIDHYYPYEHITFEKIEETRKQFLGDILQVPPIFSAVKIGGQRAYQYAREAANGETPPSPTAKTVHIEEFTITDFRPGKLRMESELPLPNNSQFPILNSQLYNLHPQHRPRHGAGTRQRSLPLSPPPRTSGHLHPLLRHQHQRPPGPADLKKKQFSPYRCNKKAFFRSYIMTYQKTGRQT